ncbi:MAG: YraN family protein [Tannerellaceae bacterium]|jgi:lipopolysaccharide export system permease protein|nr:YraN family protein [Tannerellaceae bacterium]
MKRLYTFVLQTFLPVFALTFAICLFIVLMQFIWRYMDDMVGKGLELTVLAELFLYAALFLVPMALPLSVLLASLMTFGNLGERLELLAIKSAGVSLLRIMRPLIILVASVSVGAFFFQNNVLPVVQVKLWGLLFSVRQKAPELDIPQGAFYSEITGFNLYVKEKEEDGLLKEMMIYDYSGGFNNARVILADSGRLKMAADKKFLVLTLYSGESFENLRQEDSRKARNRLLPAAVPYRRETFGSKEIFIDFDANFTRIDDSFLQNEYLGKNLHQLQTSIDTMTANLDSVRAINGRALLSSSYRCTLTKDTLFAVVAGEQLPPFDSLLHQGKVSTHDVLVRARNRVKDIKEQNLMQALTYSDESARIRRYFTEWHKKFTVSAACLLFFFIGAPLGAIIQRGGLGLPVVISIFLFIFYYILDNIGLKMARTGMWPVWQGMWLSAGALGVFGVFLTWKAVRDSVLPDVSSYVGATKEYLKEMKTKVSTGREGEQLAREYLIRKGYKILAMNWRWHRLEADIVALNEETLVIVEVKTRAKGSLINPESAVDGRKIAKLTKVADSYARMLKKTHPVRFDIVAIVTDGKEEVEITHLEDAYYPTVS